jgi:subtilisin family serine protease
MRFPKLLAVIATLLFLISVAEAQSAKTYIILAHGQGSGSTAFAQSLGPALVANLSDMGVVIAQSSDPKFPVWAKSQPGVFDVAEDQMVQWLSPRETNVEAAAVSPEATAFAANTAPWMAAQWNIFNIHADQAAANAFLGNGAVVAVLDAGLIPFHREIAANVDTTLSKSFVPSEPSITPPAKTFNHGTHVAGIIAGTGWRVQGVAPAAKIVGVKVLSAAGSGSFAWMIQGIDYASGPLVQADVINMSLGATFPRVNAGGGGIGTLIAAIGRAINIATQRGTLVVSAAGNEGMNLNAPGYNPNVCGSDKPCSVWSIPAQLGNGIAVAASTVVGYGYGKSAVYDVPAWYTNFGQSVIDVAGPGGDTQLWGIPAGSAGCTVPNMGVYPCYVLDMVLSPASYNSSTSFGYSWADGTSMATPHVSGVAALIVGKYGHHVLSPAQIKIILQSTADDMLTPGADPFSGRGRVNAARAVGIR